MVLRTVYSLVLGIIRTVAVAYASGFEFGDRVLVFDRAADYRFFLRGALCVFAGGFAEIECFNVVFWW